MHADPTQTQPNTEWRVLTLYPGLSEPLIQDCRTEKFAREWAASEREEYPQNVEIWIERREVQPWTRVDEDAPCA